MPRVSSGRSLEMRGKPCLYKQKVLGYSTWSIHQTAITWWPQPDEVNNSGYLVPELEAGNMSNVRVWVTLTWTKLWWLDDWIRASPQCFALCKFLCGVPSLQWSLRTKVVQGRKRGELATGSWVTKTHWCTWGAVRSSRRATVAQIDEKVSAGPDRKASEHTQCITVYCIAVRVCMWVRYVSFRVGPQNNVGAGPSEV